MLCQVGGGKPIIVQFGNCSLIQYFKKPLLKSQLLCIKPISLQCKCLIHVSLSPFLALIQNGCIKGWAYVALKKD